MTAFLKWIEIVNKSLWRRVLRACLSRRGKGGETELRGVGKVLFLRYERIGDMVVSMPLFRGIRAIRPGVRVGVLAGEENWRLLVDDPDVSFLYVFSKKRPIQSLREIIRARRERYDALVNLNPNPSLTGSLLANLIAPRGIKVARRCPEHEGFYDRLVDIRRENHRPLVEILLAFLEPLGSLRPRAVPRPRPGGTVSGTARGRGVLVGMGCAEAA